MCLEHVWTFAGFLENQAALEQIFVSWRVVVRILDRKEKTATHAGELIKKAACLIVRLWLDTPSEVPPSGGPTLMDSDRSLDTESDMPSLVSSSNEGYM